ncbi:unnamed protein product [Didymodactylos carnosus]|uniref:Uncharacterized protein n=1 Tax=Didymodactylos carnosus TaxID=1234261 RepID=A0A815IS45_9BILA|nr:unnamed protein product [Didymodactylos carnosus]CAF4260582.1 unnamed protein product [Didymodactylos carnosus]
MIFYNDLREWPSIMLKEGHEWLKTDFNFQLPSFCNSTSSATSRVQNPEEGCFILNHDTPILNRQTAYNTSDDLLNLIMDPLYKYWFTNPNQTVYIALCFKFDISSHADVCDNNTGLLWRR